MSIYHTGNIQPQLDLEEHQGDLSAKRVHIAPLTFYAQNSLVSGYVFYGLAAPGSNPTTSSFRLQRESLNTGEVLFGGGLTTFVHIWSAASLASINYA